MSDRIDSDAGRDEAAPGSGRNLPPLRLHVPEPKFRPGDTADFSDFDIPPAGAQARPDEAAQPGAMRDLAYGLVRVLDEDGAAVGPWNPKLPADTLLKMLRAMALTRAFDERMFRAQRQGKTSFYMKSKGRRQCRSRRRRRWPMTTCASPAIASRAFSSRAAGRSST